MRQALDSPRATTCPRLSLQGVRVDVVDGFDVKELLRTLLDEPGCHHVVTANMHYVRRAVSDSRLREVLEAASLVFPDGVPVLWAARALGARTTQRVTGHDLTNALAELSAAGGVPIFLMGAAPGVADRAAESLQRIHPNVRIAGTYSPPLSSHPFPEEEDKRMVDVVNRSGAAALLLALGCPRQDIWIADHREQLRVSVAVGVGCVLDVLAGELGRAPGWLQALGLEWLYRLSQEPGRLWRRYLLDAAFLARLMGGGVGSRLLRRRRAS